jgi:hypothetical protein
VHDIVDLETRGVPAMFVATTEFVDGADRQAKALGFDPAAVYVSHPVQDRTDEEMRAMADQAFAAIEVALTSPFDPRPTGAIEAGFTATTTGPRPTGARKPSF